MSSADETGQFTITPSELKNYSKELREAVAVGMVESEIDEWAEVLGLENWDYDLHAVDQYFREKDQKEVWATSSTRPDAMEYEIGISSRADWKDRENHTDSVPRAARHELIHVVLHSMGEGRLREMLEDTEFYDEYHSLIEDICERIAKVLGRCKPC